MPRRPRRAQAPAALAPDTPVIGYLRHSPGQDQRIDSQVAALDAYAAARGWRLAHAWWIDEFREGSTPKREQFQDFLAFARREPRAADVVLLWSFSRFARDQLLSQFHLADLRLRGYRVVSIADDIPEGDFAIVLEALTHWKNEQFLRDLSKDVKRGLRNVVTQTITLPDGRTVTGFSGGGFAPRGYRSVRVQTGTKRNGEPRHNSYWELDPLWQERVTEAWRLKATGSGVLEIHQKCRLFRDLSSYYDMFRNRQYTGARINGDVVVPAAHPAYVSQEQFAAIQPTLVSQEARMSPRRVRSDFLLSGFCFCGVCGAPLDYYPNARLADGGQVCCPRHAKRRRVLLRGEQPCGLRSISRAKLETSVLAAVRDRILTPQRVTELVAAVNAGLDEGAAHAAEERGRKLVELAELDRRIEKLLDDLEVAPPGEQSARLRQRIGERERRQAELRRELNDLEEVVSQGAQARIDAAAIVALLEDLRALLAEGATADRRAVLGAFIARIELYDDRAELCYRFPFQGPSLWQPAVPPRERPPCHRPLRLTVPLTRGSPAASTRSCPQCGRLLTPRQLRRGTVHCSRPCALRCASRVQRMREVQLNLQRDERGRFVSPG